MSFLLSIRVRTEHTTQDGTITDRDSNDLITDNLGFGYEKRRASNKEVLAKRVTYKDSFMEMLRSVPESFEYCKKYMQDREC